jgi:tetratricopeptide (TPR) repeat protein
MESARRIAGPSDRILPTLVRRRNFAVIAAVVTVCFVNAELAAWLPAMGVARAQEAAPAASSGARRLALFVVPKAKKDEMSAMFLKALLRGAADRLATAGVERAPTSPVADPAAIAVVRAKVEEGRRALAAQKWDEALKAYTAAQAELDKCLAAADRALVARTYKGLGVALLAAKRADEAKAAIKRSLIAYPGQKAVEYAYNLETRNLFQTALREIEESPNGLVSVATNPSVAEVYVDFVSRDFSPAKVSGLAAGEHVVTVWRDGYQAWSRFVTVKGGPEEAVNADLAPSATGKAIEEALAAVTKNYEKGKPADAEMAKLAEVAVATDVVVVLASAEKGGGFALTGGSWSSAGVKPINVPLPRDATLVSTTQGVLATALGMALPAESAMGQLEPPPVAMPIAEGGAGVPAAEGAEGEYLIDPNKAIFGDAGKKQETTPIVKEWWFWVAVVGGAALVGGGITGIVLATKGGEAGAATRDLRINLLGPR